MPARGGAITQRSDIGDDLLADAVRGGRARRVRRRVRRRVHGNGR